MDGARTAALLVPIREGANMCVCVWWGGGAGLIQRLFMYCKPPLRAPFQSLVSPPPLRSSSCGFSGPAFKAQTSSAVWLQAK